jgi:hypothetical protein
MWLRSLQHSEMSSKPGLTFKRFQSRTSIVAPLAALLALGGFLYPFYLIRNQQDNGDFDPSKPIPRSAKARGAFINSGTILFA